MCGRFTIMLDAVDFEDEFQLGEMPSDWAQRYNVAPSQPVVVVTDPALRNVSYMRWGLIPSWSKDESIGNRMINARAETLEIKPSFRKAFAQRRCLILADGFYEWKRFAEKGSQTQPYYFYLQDHKPFAFAGLWEVWRSPSGEDIHSCTIITCNANSVVQPIHERMPVIFNSKNCWQWLESKPISELTGLLKPYTENNLSFHPVSRLVNSPETNHPDCILPLAG